MAPSNPYSRRGPVPEDRIVIGKRKWPSYALRADPYVSLLGAGPLSCPECEKPIELEGHLWPCRGCAGVFVENAPFEGMVADITREPWTLPSCSPAPGPRHCPACDSLMNVEAYGEAIIDRCAKHGIWFDETELAAALMSVAPSDPPSVGGWLRRLFFAPR
jgi:hypothetical protein